MNLKWYQSRGFKFKLYLCHSLSISIKYFTRWTSPIKGEFEPTYE
jgi:hypothetical protein